MVSTMSASYRRHSDDIDRIPGQWPRFSAYQLIDGPPGGLLCPAPDAELEWYDPWQEGVSATNLLFRLARTVRERAEREGRYRLTPRDRHVLLRWCREHGLLGILPSDLLLLTTGQATYRRLGHTWVQEPAGANPGALFSYAVERAVALDHQSLWRYFPEAYALTSDERRLIDYPKPESDGFWRRYGEPVGVLIDSTMRLNWALERLQQSTNGVSGKSRAVPALGQLELNGIAGNVSPAVLYADPLRSMKADTLRYAWDSDSLLGHYAAMLTFQLGSGTQPRVCKGCGGVFMPTSRNMKHCSEQCKNRVAKRRERGKEGA